MPKKKKILYLYSYCKKIRWKQKLNSNPWSEKMIEFRRCTQLDIELDFENKNVQEHSKFNNNSALPRNKYQVQSNPPKPESLRDIRETQKPETSEQARKAIIIHEAKWGPRNDRLGNSGAVIEAPHQDSPMRVFPAGGQ